MIDPEGFLSCPWKDGECVSSVSLCYLCVYMHTRLRFSLTHHYPALAHIAMAVSKESAETVVQVFIRIRILVLVCARVHLSSLCLHIFSFPLPFILSNGCYLRGRALDPSSFECGVAT